MGCEGGGAKEGKYEALTQILNHRVQLVDNRELVEKRAKENSWSKGIFFAKNQLTGAISSLDDREFNYPIDCENSCEGGGNFGIR